MKVDDKELIRETLKASRFGFALFIGFWIAGWLGAPIILLYTVASVLIFFGHVKNNNTAKEFLIDYLWLTGIILSAVWLGAFLGGKGLLGLLVLGVLFALIILWRRRKLWLEWVYHIEERFLYGKRLRRKK